MATATLLRLLSEHNLMEGKRLIKEIRQDIVSEVGELLPQNFKFVRTGIPVIERYPRRKTESSKVHRGGREQQSI